MQTAFRYHVHTTLQQILNIHKPSAKDEPTLIFGKRYQQIDITGIVRISPGHGSEYPYIFNAVTFSQKSYLRTMIFYQWVHVNDLSLIALMFVNAFSTFGKLAVLVILSEIVLVLFSRSNLSNGTAIPESRRAY